jgi:Lrp/AsnC family transcriptional regulator for asnA, asnC and gidA
MPDELDIKIIKLLRKDARLSYREISRRLGVAVGTVQSRIRELEKNRIIQRYHVEIDYSRLGYGLAAVIALNVDLKKTPDLEKRLMKSRNVFGLYLVTGEFDVFLAVRFRNSNELNAFIKSISEHPAIKKTTTFLVLNTEKEAHTILD